ncbi:MAG: hypothetical protein V1493_06255 [Candidatus Diapherotrites archaeon]
MPKENSPKRIKFRAITIEGHDTSFTARVEERELTGPYIMIDTGDGRRTSNYAMDTYCKYWGLLPKEVALTEGAVDKNSLRKLLEKKGLEVHGVFWTPNSRTVQVTATFPELKRTATGRIPLSVAYLWKPDKGRYELIQFKQEAGNSIVMTKALYNLYRKNKLRVFLKLGLSMPITMARMNWRYRREKKAYQRATNPKSPKPKPARRA